MVRLIAEQEDFFVFHKPPGADFHTDRGTPGFFRQIQAALPEESLYPVHRLDKITSGLILAARSSEAAAELGDLIREGKVAKYYLAVSDKKPRKKQGLIKGDMERSRRSSWKLTRGSENPAITYFYSRSLRPGLRLFFLRIYTGRTHQIRVAMKSLGSPVLGDPLYYASGPEADRAYLHAWQLRFLWKGQPQAFRCDPLEGRLFREDSFSPAGMGNGRKIWPGLFSEESDASSGVRSFR